MRSLRLGESWARQPPQFFAQVQKWLDDLECLRIQVGKIDSIANAAAQKIIGDGFGHFDADVFLGFFGAGTQMRRHHDLRKRAQREIGGRRLGFINIQSRRRPPARFARRRQGRPL